jgi:hypothetical protein
MLIKYLPFLFSVLLIFLWSGSAFSQDYGIPDTVRVECNQNVRPNSQVVLNVYVFNDEQVGGFGVPLAFPDTFTHLDITCDSVSFVGTRAESAQYKNSDSRSIENAKNRLVVWAYWNAGSLISGSGSVAKIFFTTGPDWDTTLDVPVDTTVWPPETRLEFSTVTGWPFFPVFVKGCLRYAEFLSGDANRDRLIGVSDIVYLVNYLFKGGPSPIPLAAGDTNCDGYVSVADIVYLINYIFKSGPPPAC